jgi:hypothetical protein
MSLNIQPFIFNWRNQYDKTKKIESSLLKIFDRVDVINSDDLHNEPHWTNIGEQAYFAEQFLTAVNMFDGDIFFHIQGDIEFDRWEELVDAAQKYYEKYQWGIYAPNVDYTWYSSQNADIQTIRFTEDTNLRAVSNPDCTIWFIHRDIINTLKQNPFDLSFMKYGWGLDLILCGNSYLQKRLVMRDYEFTVDHPPGTGYMQNEAFEELGVLLSKCNPDLQNVIQAIRFDRNFLVNYFRS